MKLKFVLVDGVEKLVPDMDLPIHEKNPKTKWEAFQKATKLHEILRIAIEDFELVCQDPRYRVNMGIWHSWHENKCSVCLAGAVMAKSAEVPINTVVDITRYGLMNEFSLETINKFKALDILRRGYIKEAWQHLMRASWPGSALFPQKIIEIDNLLSGTYDRKSFINDTEKYLTYLKNMHRLLEKHDI